MVKQKDPSLRPKRTLGQHISWWWNTRVKALWTVKRVGALDKLNKRPELAFEHSAENLGDVTEHSVTAILTVYKRGQYLAQQIEALRKQTHPPQEIWVWTNSSEIPLSDYSHLADRVVVSNTNWKFWGRFALANMARTEYVCLFDDDILPQPRWLENCIATVKAGTDAILGGSGVILPKNGAYSSKHKVGWNGLQHGHVTEVDLVGHAWFFNKSHLKYMWFEQPYSWENGEDIHFSCMALKHGGIGTFVPPHPSDDPSLWSCRPDFGKAVGRTSTASFKIAGHRNVRDSIVEQQRANGWRILAEREDDSSV